MQPRRIGIVGATGQVGATLAEVLASEGRSLRLLIHTPGSAWRLARRPQELVTADILDKENLTAALSGCDVVVNCTRGGPTEMLDGLRNILNVSRSLAVSRFVHLSSVAVYGDPPAPGSECEDAPTAPRKGSYGWLKLRQDELVRDAARRGLPSVSLCLPNIGGPYSAFLLQILDALANRGFALVDGGAAPCVTVDVLNVCRAIGGAIESDVVDGRRLFVTDDDDVTWRRLLDRLVPLAPNPVTVRSISRQSVSVPASAAPGTAMSLLRALKHLVSSDVRLALRKDPLLASVDSALRDMVRRLGARTEDKLRLAIEGPTRVGPESDRTELIDQRLANQQLRGVRHRCDRAKKEIGYQRAVSFDGSMDAFERWLRQVRGMDEPGWDLARELYG
jgi:nucleoside-diphosphate-sugar epimerase